MNVLDLFSGIGGFSLGLERAGMRIVAFCEIDPYCQRVLRKHWPDVPVWGDVRSLTAEVLADANGGRYLEPLIAIERAAGVEQEQSSGDRGIDLICGGFPCQDISVAGKGAGIDGERSGLWKEFARIIGEVRPRYVIVENVSALLGRGIERVLGDLAALGYDAEWHCIPACAVGAPHRRDRVWIVAYPAWDVRTECAASGTERKRTGQCGKQVDVAYATEPRLQGGARERLSSSWGASIEFASGDWWLVEPDVGRVAHGVPSRVDRLKGLGNAIVPQIAEIIGRTILAAEQESK